MDDLVVIVHIVAGTAGLLVGPLLFFRDLKLLAAGRELGGRVGDLYAVVVVVVCLSATGLVIQRRPDLWWLIGVSALTVALVGLARSSGRRRFPGWTHGYAHGLGGSYIAQVTALIVVAMVVNGSLDGPAELLPWLGPTAVGTVLIELWRRHIVRLQASTRGAPTRVDTNSSSTSSTAAAR